MKTLILINVNVSTNLLNPSVHSSFEIADCEKETYLQVCI